jgi:hypothetical protein
MSIEHPKGGAMRAVLYFVVFFAFAPVSALASIHRETLGVEL